MVYFDVDSLSVCESFASGKKPLILTRVWVAAEISLMSSGAGEACLGVMNSLAPTYNYISALLVCYSNEKKQPRTSS